MTPEAWVGVAVAALSVIGWASAVYAQIAGMRSDVRHVLKRLENVDSEQDRLWEHVDNLHGRVIKLEAQQ